MPAPINLEYIGASYKKIRTFENRIPYKGTKEDSRKVRNTRNHICRSTISPYKEIKKGIDRLLAGSMILQGLLAVANFPSSRRFQNAKSGKSLFFWTEKNRDVYSFVQTSMFILLDTPRQCCTTTPNSFVFSNSKIHWYLQTVH